MSKRILFVCTGNTCRSPMAAGIFKKMYGENGYDVDSAGLVTYGGDCVSENAAKACQEIGVDISEHKSKSISTITVDDIDIFVPMTKNHAEFLKKLNIPDQKIFILKNDIPDPFMMGLEKYRETRIAIENSLKDLAEKLEMI